MGKFLLGVIFTLIIIIGGGYWWVSSGHVDSRAVPNGPSQFERRTAMHAVDEWVDAHAPKLDNPFQPTTENLVAGQKVYVDNCAWCHGSLKEPISPMRTKFFPPVPQLMARTPDDPDANFFYVTKYGIKLSGMPGWDGVITDDDIWKAVLFIKNSSKMKDVPAQTPAATPTPAK
jgi:mono/diheme cytochrome c family protein